MADTGIIQRRKSKAELIADPPIEGEIVFALDTFEFGTVIDGLLVWRKFDYLVKSVSGKIGDVVLDKSDVGLSNVNNTSDVNKPISRDTQSALDKLNRDIISHSNLTNNPHDVTKEQIGLGNVDNTSDLDKPISTSVQNILDTKLDFDAKAADSTLFDGFKTDYFAKTATTYTKDKIDDIVSNKADISYVNSQLALKADKSYVDNTLVNYVTSAQHNSDISNINLTIDNKESEINTAITNLDNTKASIAYVDLKFNQASDDIDNINQEILDLQTNKADKTYVDNAVLNNSNGASTSYIDSQDNALQNQITQNTNAITAIQSDYVNNDTFQASINNLNTTKADNSEFQTFKSNVTSGLHDVNSDIDKLYSQTSDLSAKKADLDYIKNFVTSGYTPINDFKDFKKDTNGTLSSHTIQITNLQNDKADITYVDSLNTTTNNRIDDLSTKKADITYVDGKVADLVNSAPTTLDTLNELAKALGDDPNFATDITNLIGTKLDSSANAVSASKLETARKFSLSGDATGSVVFDGTSDVDITVSVLDDSHNHIISNIDGLQNALDSKLDDSQLDTTTTLGTSNTKIPSQNAVKVYVDNAISGKDDANEINYNNTTSGLTATNVQAAVDEVENRLDNAEATISGIKASNVPVTASGNLTSTNVQSALEELQSDVDTRLVASTYTASDILTKIKTVDGTNSGLDADKLDGNDSSYFLNATNLNTGIINDDRLPDIISSNITGNANTATKLQTARVIELDGDVTGSISFDGSSNVSILSTVVDDSHNHIISNVDGLQTALDEKLSLSGKAADSDKLDGLDSSQFLRSDVSDTHSGTITPDSDNSIDLGSSSLRYSNVYAVNFEGSIVSAEYADLAEKYKTDVIYPNGTVLAVGGDEELTLYTNQSSVAGVISTNPGLLLNSTDDGQYIALKGRTSCLISSPVKKGQFIIADSYGKGKGINEITSFREQNLLLGIALEDSDSESVEIKI